MCRSCECDTDDDVLSFRSKQLPEQIEPAELIVGEI
jgi:hypothetical protein